MYDTTIIIKKVKYEEEESTFQEEDNTFSTKDGIIDPKLSISYTKHSVYNFWNKGQPLYKGYIAYEFIKCPSFICSEVSPYNFFQKHNVATVAKKLQMGNDR